MGSEVAVGMLGSWSQTCLPWDRIPEGLGGALHRRLCPVMQHVPIEKRPRNIGCLVQQTKSEPGPSRLQQTECMLLPLTGKQVPGRVRYEAEVGLTRPSVCYVIVFRQSRCEKILSSATNYRKVKAQCICSWEKLMEIVFTL